MASQKARRPPSVDCSSGPLGPRANKRRFVNLLQQLGGATILELSALTLLCYHKGDDKKLAALLIS